MDNAISIDLEDWFCVKNLEGLVPFERWDSCELRVEESTRKILTRLDAHGVKATFFVLGWIAERVKGARDRMEAEHLGLVAYIEFARAHPNLYRIIEEAQFVAPDAYKAHYDRFAERYCRNLSEAAERGEIREGDETVRAWALIGMSVFLGLRYGIWDTQSSAEDVARKAADLIRRGLEA